MSPRPRFKIVAHKAQLTLAQGAFDCASDESDFESEPLHIYTAPSGATPTSPYTVSPYSPAQLGEYHKRLTNRTVQQTADVAAAPAPKKSNWRARQREKEARSH
jgi:hypothetical protein